MTTEQPWNQSPANTGPRSTEPWNAEPWNAEPWNQTPANQAFSAGPAWQPVAQHSAAVSPLWDDEPWAGTGQPWLVSGSGFAPVLTAPAAAAAAPQSSAAAARGSASNRQTRLALTLVSIAAALTLLFSLLAGRAYGRAAMASGRVSVEMATTSAGGANLFTLAWLASALLGAAGWVLAVAAVAARRGTQASTWAIVIGCLAPVLSVVAAVAIMAPALDAVPR